MKRNLLAIAIPAILAAGTANASVEVWNQDGNKVNIEGRVKAATHITHKDNDNGDHSDAQFGFTGETQISDSLIGYGHAEWQTSAKNDNSMGEWDSETRYAFAGLSFGNLGSIDYGRNDGLIKGISEYTDVLPEFGGDSSGQEQYVLATRRSNLITYRNGSLADGLSVAVQYADRLNKQKGIDDTYKLEKINPQDVSPKKTDTRETYAISFDYAILDTGVSFAGAYAETSGKDYNTTWASGLKYDANDLLVAANYFQSRNKKIEEVNDKAKRYWGFEAVVQYGIDFEVGRLLPSVAYIQHKQKDMPEGKERGDIVKYVDVGATYKFNKNIAAIVDYKINLLREKDKGSKGEAAQTKNTVGLGLVYEF